eukprot:CAMPEP_0115516124 /NCGR_PEP_ID=MMETSP0271-20121206/76595_1 /TAXON_ID=71861 /ORGANISM="Scrippsiella trochoidea, Strain CCMP3099" /LENGTH=124 /DNA_ID=CAMNT_0002946767 /DNA_START=188 /DNA_END=560 /DNA_ORIENTATION=+
MATRGVMTPSTPLGPSTSASSATRTQFCRATTISSTARPRVAVLPTIGKLALGFITSATRLSPNNWPTSDSAPRLQIARAKSSEERMPKEARFLPPLRRGGGKRSHQSPAPASLLLHLSASWLA